ncbi:MAG TPA: futalosine hydrolase, partial [Phaeodactylibacter sp.]|nr:futalosine hydrolase [Phaeodactylibacter sp.]
MTTTIVAATPFEIAPLCEWLRLHFGESLPYIFNRGSHKVVCIISGVGQAVTAFHLGRYLAQHKTDLCINAGIAGSFVERFAI